MNYLGLWQSGAIAKVGATCRTLAELARKLGTTADALSSAHRRLVAQGHDLPSPGSYLPPRSNRPLDQWDEPTNPGAPMFTDSEGSCDPLAGLEPWGTAIERQVLESLQRTGSIVGTAEDMGISPERVRAHLSELERRAARRGWAPGSDMTKTVPAGYHVKGVSTYYDADGNVIGQWVKSQQDPEGKLELLLDAVKQIAEPFAGSHDPVPPPAATTADLLCVYPMGDPHLGMYAWASETGEDFDLDIAERNLVAAVDHLVDLAPPADEALIINLGDFFHSDTNQNRTARSGHALDVDTRWAKVLSIGIRTMRRCIDRALLKHRTVRVICEIGNHDDHSSVMLALCLSNYYEREPRVVIDTSPEKFHWHRFGDCLIGVTHGDTVKFKDLAGVMAVDRAKDWGETKHRHWYCGHVHHDTVKELPGVTVETFRTLAARDNWHHAAGYRSGRDMKCDVWHRRYGIITRHVVGIHQLSMLVDAPWAS